MTTVADTLGVCRSNLVDRLKSWSKPRGPYHKAEDEELLPIIEAWWIKGLLMPTVIDQKPCAHWRRLFP